MERLKYTESLISLELKVYQLENSLKIEFDCVVDTQKENQITQFIAAVIEKLKGDVPPPDFNFTEPPKE